MRQVYLSERFEKRVAISVGIIDFGVGNLRNIQKAIDLCGAKSTISSDIDVLRKQDKLVFPGVGAFSACMECINKTFGDALTPELERVPVLAICIGLQVLFQDSEEHGPTNGLGILKGNVRKLPTDHGLRVPHVGWNQVFPTNKAGPLFKDIPAGSHFYFTHSYFVETKEPNLISSYCHYGSDICASIERDNIFATQFHPEKSQKLGLTMLQNFVLHCG